MAKNNTARNIFSLLVIAALLIGAAVVGYIKSPTIHNPVILEEALLSAQERFDQVQEKARLTEHNGYLNEFMRPYWGLKTELVEGCPAQLACEGWNAYSESAKGEYVDHGALWKAQDPAYLKARQDFEIAASEIVSSAQKPLFVVPSSRNTAEAPILNFIRLRASTQGISGYLDSKTAEGKPSDTLALWQAGLSIGGKLRQGMTLIHSMIGIAAQAILLDSAFRNFGPDCELTFEQWLTLAQATQEAALREDGILRAIQGEYLMNINTLDDVLKGRSASAGVPVGSPMLIRREERIFKNHMAKVFTYYNNPGTSTYPQLEEFSWWRNLLGKSGMVADMLVSSSVRAAAQIQLTRGKTSALSTYFGLRAYKAKHGGYPKNLMELQELGLEPLSGLEWDNPNYHYQSGEKTELKLDFPAGLLTSIAANDEAPEHCDWVKFTTDSLVMSL